MILKSYPISQIFAVILAGSFYKMSFGQCTNEKESLTDKTFETTDFADDTDYL